MGDGKVVIKVGRRKGGRGKKWWGKRGWVGRKCTCTW